MTLPEGAPVATADKDYLGTAAQRDLSTGVKYLHGDLIGSTDMLTDATGSANATTAYTAFGEVVGDPLDTRYQYAGAWGYESGLLERQGANTNLPPIRLQHVGYRWYEPAIGRFVQRDPIGIWGGLNVYAYVGSNPLLRIDPSGKAWIWAVWGAVRILIWVGTRVGPWIAAGAVTASRRPNATRRATTWFINTCIKYNSFKLPPKIPPTFPPPRPINFPQPGGPPPLPSWPPKPFGF